MDSLDGNGLLWLALQDMSLPSFQSGAKTVSNLLYLTKSPFFMLSFQAFAKSGVVDPNIQNILVVVTDTEWDLKGLKDTKGVLAKEENIIQNTKNNFDRIFALSGSQMDPLVSGKAHVGTKMKDSPNRTISVAPLQERPTLSNRVS